MKAEVHCCETMRYWVNYQCEQHRHHPADCPDNILTYVAAKGTYGIRIHDSGASYVGIKYCPWCGTELPPNKPMHATCEDARA